MKFLTAIMLLMLSCQALSWECLDKQKGMESSVREHIDLATEIYMGKVINAYLVEDIYKIVFELKVSDVFKGRYQSHVTLSSTSDSINPDISIGKNYILFLYGSKEVDFCGLTIETKHINTAEKLKSYVGNGAYFDRWVNEQLGALLAYKASQP